MTKAPVHSQDDDALVSSYALIRLEQVSKLVDLAERTEMAGIFAARELTRLLAGVKVADFRSNHRPHPLVGQLSRHAESCSVLTNETPCPPSFLLL